MLDQKYKYSEKERPVVLGTNGMSFLPKLRGGGFNPHKCVVSAYKERISVLCMHIPHCEPVYMQRAMAW